jgi:methyl-accepting chemotaxis protein
MQELVKSSQQIAQELALVEDMARQTNAIALNAGIESARANDKDRGFLIMADEATKIAERTDRTAKEIGRTPGNDARTRREC